MELALNMKNRPGSRTEERDFRNWLHRTVRKLKRGDLPPESWDTGHSPIEESAAQRRIATLISSIAAKDDHRRH